MDNTLMDVDVDGPGQTLLVDNAVRAAKLEIEFLDRLKTEWAPELQKICEQQDAYMKPVCELLRQHILDFQKKKAALFATMVRVEGAVNAQRAFAMSLDDMMPLGLRQMIVLARIASTPILDADIATTQASPPRPQTTAVFVPDDALPGVNAIKPPTSAIYMPTQTSQQTISAAGSTANEPDGSIGKGLPKTQRNANPISVNANVLTIRASGLPRKRIASSSDSASLTTTPGKRAKEDPKNVPVAYGSKSLEIKELPLVPQAKQPSPRLPTISTWEVEGEEYIFQFPPFGAGWFVLRCHRSSEVKAVTFNTHPLETGVGALHFNSSGCKYHDGSKMYNQESMMAAFGRRVVDESGEDITDDWAEESNEMLEHKRKSKKIKRAATPKAKSKLRRQSFVMTAALKPLPLSDNED